MNANEVGLSAEFPLMLSFPPLYTYQPSYNFAPNVWADFFVYQFPVFSNIAVDGNQTQQIIIQNDSDFELRRINYAFTLADAAYTASTRPIPNCTVQIQDTGSGRNLFSNPVPVAALMGTAENSQRDLPWTKIFARNSAINITVVNFDAAVTTGQLYITFLGRKLFTGAGQMAPVPGA